MKFRRAPSSVNFPAGTPANSNFPSPPVPPDSPFRRSFPSANETRVLPNGAPSASFTTIPATRYVCANVDPPLQANKIASTNRQHKTGFGCRTVPILEGAGLDATLPAPSRQARFIPVSLRIQRHPNLLFLPRQNRHHLRFILPHYIFIRILQIILRPLERQDPICSRRQLRGLKVPIRLSHQQTHSACGPHRHDVHKSRWRIPVSRAAFRKLDDRTIDLRTIVPQRHFDRRHGRPPPNHQRRFQQILITASNRRDVSPRHLRRHSVLARRHARNHKSFRTRIAGL